jgi:hypothetical protein
MESQELAKVATALEAAPERYRETITFANGRGISIINDGYGGKAGLFEICVLGPDGDLDLDSPLTEEGGGVMGWLDVAGVLGMMQQISQLPKAIES